MQHITQMTLPVYCIEQDPHTVCITNSARPAPAANMCTVKRFPFTTNCALCTHPEYAESLAAAAAAAAIAAEQGPKGDTGLVGPQGITGIQGLIGATGRVGANGELIVGLTA
jgi:hypothetical protein